MIEVTVFLLIMNQTEVCLGKCNYNLNNLVWFWNLYFSFDIFFLYNPSIFHWNATEAETHLPEIMAEKASPKLIIGKVAAAYKETPRLGENLGEQF